MPELSLGEGEFICSPGPSGAMQAEVQLDGLYGGPYTCETCGRWIPCRHCDDQGGESSDEPR